MFHERPLSRIVGLLVKRYNAGHVEVIQQVYNLYSDPAVRSDSRRMIAPLESDGFDLFEARDEGQVAVRVSREEAEYFAPGEGAPEDLLFNGESEALLEVVKPSFVWAKMDGIRWKKPIFCGRKRRCIAREGSSSRGVPYQRRHA
jgi:hypothetical protein